MFEVQDSKLPNNREKNPARKQQPCLFTLWLGCASAKKRESHRLINVRFHIAFHEAGAWGPVLLGHLANRDASPLKGNTLQSPLHSFTLSERIVMGRTRGCRWSPCCINPISELEHDGGYLASWRCSAIAMTKRGKLVKGQPGSQKKTWVSYFKMPLPGFHHRAIKLRFLWWGRRRGYILKARPPPMLLRVI